jgi:DNA-binding CsgD family transcriptional regulator
MRDYHLDQQELAELRAARRGARNAREAYRLKAVILHGSSLSPSEIAAALLIDDNTVRNHLKRDKRGDIAVMERMNVFGSETLLTAARLTECDAYPQQLQPSAVSVARWVEACLDLRYTDSAMTELLHRLGQGHKKPELLPGKAPAPEVHESAACKQLRKNKGKQDAILFTEATHPQHNAVLGLDWINRVVLSAAEPLRPAAAEHQRPDRRGDAARGGPLRRRHRWRISHRSFHEDQGRLPQVREDHQILRQCPQLPLLSGARLSGAIANRFVIPSAFHAEPEPDRTVLEILPLSSEISAQEYGASG